MIDILGYLLAAGWIVLGVLGEAAWSSKGYSRSLGIAWRSAVFGGGINLLLAMVAPSMVRRPEDLSAELQRMINQARKKEGT